MTGAAVEPAFFADPRGRDPSDPYARGAETLPRLSDEQVGRVSAFGSLEALPRGTVLFERDDRGVDFFLVLEGHIEIYEPGPDGAPVVMTVHAERQFTGELDLFNDRAILVGGRMGVDGRVVRLSRANFRRMLAAEPDVADIVMRAFILRRAGFIQHGEAAVTIVGQRRSADSLRIQRFLSRNGHPFVVADLDADAQAPALLRERGVSDEEGPVVLCRPGWRPPSTPPRRGSRRWCSRPRRPAARPAPARGSRTTSASRPASPARRWRPAPRCRPRSSGRGSQCPGRSSGSGSARRASPTRSS